jgi:hypothetical protein
MDQDVILVGRALYDALIDWYGARGPRLYRHVVEPPRDKFDDENGNDPDGDAAMADASAASKSYIIDLYPELHRFDRIVVPVATQSSSAANSDASSSAGLAATQGQGQEAAGGASSSSSANSADPDADTSMNGDGADSPSSRGSPALLDNASPGRADKPKQIAHICVGCGASNATSRCKTCQVAYYCNERCQKR